MSSQAQIPRTQQVEKPVFMESLPADEEEFPENPLQQLLGEKSPLTSQALEGPIDPATYRLGPGDLVGVIIMGEVDKELSARVTADGALRLPTIGIFKVGNRVFAEVQQEILTQAQRSYRTQQMAVTLLELRSFKASVGGMVRRPGTYILTPIDRIASLLTQAGGFYNPATTLKSRQAQQKYGTSEWGEKIMVEHDQISEVPAYSTRRVQLIHRDGSTQNVDLLLFLRAGRPEGNPFLQDGDFLMVPPLSPRAGLLGVYGAVNNQGLFEFLPGDDIQRALLLAGGLTPEARRDSVEITRFGDDQVSYETFFVCLDDSGSLTLPLLADDRIFVRPRHLYHPRFQVELRGEVMKPGFYPVRAEGTPLTDILEAAGGFTPRASLHEATLTRHSREQQVDPEVERLRQMRTLEMTWQEYQYLKVQTLEISGRVAVDLQRLAVEGDPTQNILLQDQDILEVPPTSHTVKVSGQVGQPGITGYEPGKNYKWYVEKSGGFSWNANPRKVRIIKGITGKWLKPGSTTIEVGDTIFIPEKAGVHYWNVSKDVIMVLAQIATIYLVIQSTKN
jgi:protein involved in polysaccharide export with SLBB domain